MLVTTYLPIHAIQVTVDTGSENVVANDARANIHDPQEQEDQRGFYKLQPLSLAAGTKGPPFYNLMQLVKLLNVYLTFLLGNV